MHRFVFWHPVSGGPQLGVICASTVVLAARMLIERFGLRPDLIEELEEVSEPGYAKGWEMRDESLMLAETPEEIAAIAGDVRRWAESGGLSGKELEDEVRKLWSSIAPEVGELPGNS